MANTPSKKCLDAFRAFGTASGIMAENTKTAKEKRVDDASVFLLALATLVNGKYQVPWASYEPCLKLYRLRHGMAFQPEHFKVDGKLVEQEPVGLPKNVQASMRTAKSDLKTALMLAPYNIEFLKATKADKSPEANKKADKDAAEKQARNERITAHAQKHGVSEIDACNAIALKRINDTNNTLDTEAGLYSARGRVLTTEWVKSLKDDRETMGKRLKACPALVPAVKAFMATLDDQGNVIG